MRTAMPNRKINGALEEDGRETEDDQQRRALGPRGVPGSADPSHMTPQREKKTPKDEDPPHTA
jgi:hypothetical protein